MPSKDQINSEIQTMTNEIHKMKVNTIVIEADRPKQSETNEELCSPCEEGTTNTGE